MAFAKCGLKINGAAAYRHIVFYGDATGKSKTDSTLYKGDVQESPNQIYGNVRHYAYITQAPGLVKIQMTIFMNNIKASQQFFIAAQFDRGYSFLEFYSSVPCQIKLNAYGPYASAKYSFFTSKEDAFSASLQQLTFGSSTFALPNPGKHYIRMSYNISADLVDAQSFGVDVKTFSQSPCQNQCLEGNEYFALHQGTGSVCSCYFFGKFFDIDTRQCKSCDSSSTSTLCKQMREEICGNGIKQRFEMCDSDDSIGCTNCTIDAGYFCTEKEFNRSTCSKYTVPGPPTPAPTPTPTNEQKTEEAGLSIEARNRIIIGVCVGVGGGIIVGIIIFFIVKHFKPRPSETQYVSQEKIVQPKTQSESVAVIL